MQVPSQGINQQLMQQNFHQQQIIRPPGTQRGWQRPTTSNWGSSNYSWSDESSIMYAAASSCAPNYMMANPHHILLGMETNVAYLKELLTKEIDMNVKERTTVKILTQDVECKRQVNNLLIEELKKAQAETNAVNSVLQDAENELSVNKKLLENAKKELITACDSINNLKKTNAILEHEVAVLQHLTKEKHPDEELTSPSEIVKTKATIECQSSEKSLLDEEKNNYETLRSQYDLIKDKLNSAIHMKNVVTCMFKELGKKNLYMMEYSGEQMYSYYEKKHTEFIGQLKSLKIDSANYEKCSVIEHTFDCLQQQLILLKKCRDEFRISIELLMCRIDQEFVLVSDLSVQPKKPSFYIPIDDFDQLLQVITQIGTLELDEKVNLDTKNPLPEP